MMIKNYFKNIILKLNKWIIKTLFIKIKSQKKYSMYSKYSLIKGKTKMKLNNLEKRFKY